MIHFILYVQHQGRSRDFYRQILRVEPRLDVPGMTEFDLAPGTVLGLMPEAGIRALLGDRLPDPAGAHGTPRAEIYLNVGSAVREFQERAIAAGATVLSELAPRSWGHSASYCLDPDGHVIAFASDTADETPAGSRDAGSSPC